MTLATESEAPVERHDAILGDGSEAEFRDYEVVCPVTGYVYNRVLSASPYIDAEGNIL